MSATYALLSAKRQSEDKGKSKDKGAPGVGTYIDVVAALVPAEVLAVNAVLVAKLTDETNGAVSIDNSNAMKLVFWLSVITSLFLYFVTDRVTARKQAQIKEEETTKPVKPVGWLLSDYLRAVVPALAYVVWVMLVKPSPFDSVFPSVAEGTRWVVALFAALALGAVAKLLTDKADRDDPPRPGGDGEGGDDVVETPPGEAEPELAA